MMTTKLDQIYKKYTVKRKSYEDNYSTNTEDQIEKSLNDLQYVEYLLQSQFHSDINAISEQLNALHNSLLQFYPEYATANGYYPINEMLLHNIVSNILDSLITLDELVQD